MKRKQPAARGRPTSPPNDNVPPAPAAESAEDRQRRVRAAFLKLPPGEQAKLLDRAALRDAERVLAGTVLERARGRFYDPVTPEGHHVGTPNAIAHVGDLLERAGARDPVEEMLLTQMAWAHARVAYLTTLANKQDQLKQIQTISEAVERAHNTCRRLALALADYRRPPRQFIAARQFNQAGQQLVQNNTATPVGGPEPAPNERKTEESGTNEKGLPAPAELPPLGRRLGGPEGECSTDEAVAADAGPVDAGGQGTVEPQRVEARRAER